MAKVRVASSNATWKSSRSSAEAYRQNGLRMRQLSLYREPHTYKCGLSGKAITASIPKENRLLQSHDRNCTLALFRTCVRTGEKAITRRFPLLRGHHFPPGTARTRCFPTTEKPGAPADARNSFPTHRQSPPGRGLSCSEVWSSRRAPLFPGGPTRARSKRRGNASTRPFHPSKGLPRPIRVSTLLVVDSNSENSESQRRLHKPRGKKRIRTPCAPSGALGCT